VKKVKAYHEAGHAVVARALGVVVEYVTVLEDGRESGGQVLTHGAAHCVWDSDKAMRLAAMANDAIICLAGPRAQQLYRPPKNPPDAWKSDIKVATSISYFAALIESGVDVGRSDTLRDHNITNGQEVFATDFFRRCSDEALKLVEKHWPAIERVAKALLNRPILNGADLDDLIGTAPCSALSSSAT
jgi:hypothetical protein